ncbi:50S ribosomal protein L11 methyltransferase [Entomobacter blattae]|uniref:Ribosomal protein L11 methyltransferase n=1 Tax=Entomobacter blattae TaxID=2762277 RepID=A0A7H1NSA5_9PROT|nr:50S ribosomal protein L11 methyltransferase [Entomobacter blattae]QNT78665.1 Ribosomal protein L11 methyltransferase [Entomobacter blattae]
MRLSHRRHATQLETLSLVVPDYAVEAYEKALGNVCTTVGIFEIETDEAHWRLEGVKDTGYGESELAAALAIAELTTGYNAPLERVNIPAEGWLARTYEAFPEQNIGRRFVVRGTHLPASTSSKITLILDAGIAFGSGEHGSTRGCLRALESIAWRKPQRIIDMGCGSGILAMAASALLKKPVIGVDIEPWSVRVANTNAQMNHLGQQVKFFFGNGWNTPQLTSYKPFDLVFANILARPLCKMAYQMKHYLAPGASIILAGLLKNQIRMVLAAYSRQGIVLEKIFLEGEWATLLLRNPF